MKQVPSAEIQKSLSTILSDVEVKRDESKNKIRFKYLTEDAGAVISKITELFPRSSIFWKTMTVTIDGKKFKYKKEDKEKQKPSKMEILEQIDQDKLRSDALKPQELARSDVQMVEKESKVKGYGGCGFDFKDPFSKEEIQQFKEDEKNERDRKARFFLNWGPSDKQGVYFSRLKTDFKTIATWLEKEKENANFSRWKFDYERDLEVGTVNPYNKLEITPTVRTEIQKLSKDIQIDLNKYNYFISYKFKNENLKTQKS